jgi:cytochrome c oxidase cbb3-type subunit III
MADFTNEFWDWYIGVISVVSILACALLLWSAGRTTVPVNANAKNDGGNDGKSDGTTGHVWDEDLRELNNPLPLWWMGLFVITVIFALVYLVVFPGLGSFKGTLGWSSTKEHKQDVEALSAQIAPLYAKFSSQSVEALSTNPKALMLGERLFMNNCSQCHGSEGRGSMSYPNLTNPNAAWLGERGSDHIIQTVTNGRAGMMPPMGAAIGDESKISELANYVLSLSGDKHDSAKAIKGSASFAVCAACHGADGKGNKALGAPNLTDRYWLHGTGEDSVIQTIKNGRNNIMPAQAPKLSVEQIRVVSAYVLSLSSANK